jgi:hypothetical protein
MLKSDNAQEHSNIVMSIKVSMVDFVSHLSQIDAS